MALVCVRCESMSFEGGCSSCGTVGTWEEGAGVEKCKD